MFHLSESILIKMNENTETVVNAILSEFTDLSDMVVVPMLPHDLVVCVDDTNKQVYPKCGTMLRATIKDSKTTGTFGDNIPWIDEPKVSGLELVPDRNSTNGWTRIGKYWEDLTSVLCSIDDRLHSPGQMVIVVSEFAARELAPSLMDVTKFKHIEFAYPDTGTASVVRDTKGQIVGVRRLIRVEC